MNGSTISCINKELNCHSHVKFITKISQFIKYRAGSRQLEAYSHILLVFIFLAFLYAKLLIISSQSSFATKTCSTGSTSYWQKSKLYLPSFQNKGDLGFEDNKLGRPLGYTGLFFPLIWNWAYFVYFKFHFNTNSCSITSTHTHARVYA